MAGNHPNDPSWRMPYDVDGTRLFQVDGTTSTERTEDMAILNDENTTTSVTRDLTWAWVFPESRSLEYMMVYSDGMGTFWVQFSTNSTNGVDGAWTEPVQLINALGAAPGAYRTGIRRAPSVCKALRIYSVGAENSESALTAVHLYGDFDYTKDVNSLVFWHPTLDGRLPPEYLDYGWVIRGSSEDLTFRVRNLSTTLNAVAVSVFLDSPTVTDPPVGEQHLLSLEPPEPGERVVFTAIENIGDLGPGVVSGEIMIRRVTSRQAQLGMHSFRLRATASMWEPYTS